MTLACGEIHDLEFGLGLAALDQSDGAGLEDAKQDEHPSQAHPAPGPVQRAKELGAVRVRSNVTENAHAWDLVPGEDRADLSNQPQ